MHGSIATRPRPGARVTTVNITAFNDIMLGTYGVSSNLDVARFLGCGEGTISRLRSGDQQNVGGSFISCVGGAVTHTEFFKIFDFRARTAA